jgi:hypothetical protein
MLVQWPVAMYPQTFLDVHNRMVSFGPHIATPSHYTGRSPLRCAAAYFNALPWCRTASSTTARSSGCCMENDNETETETETETENENKNKNKMTQHCLFVSSRLHLRGSISCQISGVRGLADKRTSARVVSDSSLSSYIKDPSWLCRK